MTTTTTTPVHPPLLAAGRPTRAAGLGRLTRIELRKSVDTRSGRWLLGGVALIGVAMALISALAGSAKDHTFHDAASSIQGTMAVLLPVVSILLVTSEFSQRTALQTFALTPRRDRIVSAKLLAGSLISIIVAAYGLGLSWLATEFAHGHPVTGEWRQAGTVVVASLLVQLMSQLSGMGFAFLLLNTPAAIVANFVIPVAWTAIFGGIHALHKIQPWIDPTKATDNLLGGHMNGHHWVQVGVVALIWVVALIAAGCVRVSRKEVN